MFTWQGWKHPSIPDQADLLNCPGRTRTIPGRGLGSGGNQMDDYSIAHLIGIGLLVRDYIKHLPERGDNNIRVARKTIQFVNLPKSKIYTMVRNLGYSWDRTMNDWVRSAEKETDPYNPLFWD